MRVGWRALRALILLAAVGTAVVVVHHYLTLPDLEFGAEGAALNGVILAFLIGFRNKLSVFMQWVYSYLTYKRGARVIYGFSDSAGTPDGREQGHGPANMKTTIRPHSG